MPFSDMLRTHRTYWVSKVKITSFSGLENFQKTTTGECLNLIDYKILRNIFLLFRIGFQSPKLEGKMLVTLKGQTKIT